MKLKYGRTFLVGFAFLSICAFWQIYDSIIPLILRNTFGIGDALSGGIMALDNVFALLLLPVFGALSDKTKTRLGRRMPYIVIGTAFAVVLMLMLPVADNLVSLPFFIIVLFLTLLAMSVYRSPAVALMPDVTPKPLRSKANAIINLMGALGGVVSLGLIAFLIKGSGKPDYFPLFLIISVLMAVSVAVLLLTVKENKLRTEREKLEAEFTDEPSPVEAEKQTSKLAPDVRRSLIFILISIFLWFTAYNAVTTAFSKYAQTYWGLEGGSFANSMMVGTVAAVVSYIPVGFIATKIGRKKTILIGVGILLVLFVIASFYKHYNFSINVLFAFVGFAWASINVNSYPMVVEMSKGSDIGKYTGLYYTFSMAAQIATPILSGALLQYVGYWTLFPYAAVFSVLAFITMCMVKHGDAKPVKPASKLEAYDTED